MAKKKSHYATVRSAELGSVAETANARVLQVDQELSKMNRRLYRMGRYYECKIDIKPSAVGNYEIYCLRDDWAVQKGFAMAMQHYLENTMDEREAMSKTQLARWADFRVSPGVASPTNTLVAKYHDQTMAPLLLTSGNFELANVVDAAGTTRTFTWSPLPSATEYSILNEYDRAGDAQNSPENLAAPGPYENIDATRDAAVYDHLEQDGNQPPYDRNTVNQSRPWVKIATLGSGAVAQKLSTGFFTAPCGIIVIVGSAADWDSSFASFTVKAGDYKGVHAPAMLETKTVTRTRKVVK